ncbi:MAG: hypothetical protein ABIR62_02210 [Dokdonella sp.]
MNVATRFFGFAVAVALVAGVGWRVVKVGMADHLVAGDPHNALAWNPANPSALAAIAKKHLDDGEPAPARDIALTLLQREPANGDGFVVLSDWARTQGEAARTSEWSDIALRYAPQALAPRAWIANEDFVRGNYAAALDGIDKILRVCPRQYEQLFPAMLDFARTPEFADALATKLISGPTWKSGMVTALLSKATPDAMDRVLSTMQRQGALDSATTAQWIDRLAKVGAWGEAYARWVSATNGAHANRLSNVFNGGFESAPTNSGFDWRVGDSAGVVIERAAVSGATGSNAMSLTFLGRRSDSIPLHHWLLLSSGSYRLTFRATAHDLRSDRGVEWVVRCQQSGKELAASERLTGDFQWTSHEVDFEVPDADCQAQDLFLRNAGANGAGKVIRGSISFDDVAIGRTDVTNAPRAEPSH